MTIYTLFEDCDHHIFEDGLHLSRTPGGQWEDVFQTIDCVTRSEEQSRAFFKPNFEPVQPVLQVNEVNYGRTTSHYHTLDQSYNGQPHQVWFRQPGVHSRKAKDNSTIHTVLGSLPVTSVRESTWSRTSSLQKEKSRDKLKDTVMAKHYKNKI